MYFSLIPWRQFGINSTYEFPGNSLAQLIEKEPLVEQIQTKQMTDFIGPTNLEQPSLAIGNFLNPINAEM